MLDIEITRRCNLNCITCFVRHGKGRNKELTKLQIYDIIDDAREFYGESIHLTGGEPFVHPDIFDVIEYGRKSGYQNVIINTNGTLLNEDNIRRLREFGGFLHLTVSLDGFEELNDKVRGRGVFKRVTDSLRLCEKHKINFSIMSVVTRTLLDSLGSWIDYLLSEFPTLEGIHLIPVGDVSGGVQDSLTEYLGNTEILKLGMLVASYILDNKPVTVIDYPIINLVLMRFGVPIDKIFQCMALRRRICVQANLDITPCHPVSYPLGSFKRGAFREIRDSELYKKISERDYEMCSDCEYKAICGNCRAFVTAKGFDILGNDYSCNDILKSLGLTVF
jgi:radical SAM protein with 4Fe4S-binding SPASM domain